MLVILNSDVLYTSTFVHGRVHRNWRQFAEGCHKVGARLIIPRTTLLEVNLRQKELADDEKLAIRSAMATFTKYKLPFESVDVDQIVIEPDLIGLFRQTGVSIDAEAATLEDFEDAERRACLHLPPGPPRTRSPAGGEDTRSDEMRDLVIWATACRLARTAGGAILVSRDNVHTNKHATSEGETQQLRVAFDLDEALGMLGAETAAGKIAEQFLREAWPTFLRCGVPVSSDYSVKTITDAVFTQGTRGIASARFAFSAANPKGKRFRAKASVSSIDDGAFVVTLADSHIDQSRCDAANIGATVARAGQMPTDDYQDRLSDLRNLLG